MFMNHTDVRMVHRKIREGLNLVYSPYEMDGWDTKSDFSINQQQSLDPFLLAISVDVPLSSHYIETHKAEQPPEREWSVTKVMFHEL